MLRYACALAAEYVKEAVQEDNAGNYQKAFDLYKIALEYFSTHLKYEKNPRAKEAITAKARRAPWVTRWLVAELSDRYTP